MNNQRQAILVMVSSLLQAIQNHQEIEKEMEAELQESLQAIKQCRLLLKEMNSDPTLTIVENSDDTCIKLEIACLCLLHSLVLIDRVKEIMNLPPKPFSFYLDLYYILDQLHCENNGIKKDLLRTALNYQLQTTISIDRVQETIHDLFDCCECKDDCFHWAEQLLQIIKSQNMDSVYSHEYGCS